MTQAQWIGSLSLDNGYDDNMFRNYSATASASTDLSLMYGYFPEEENWAINYSGSLSSFSEYPDRMYTLQNLAASYSYAYGQNEENVLSILGSGNMRIDGAEYTLYDYSQAVGSLSLRQKLVADIPLLLSYRARYRNYPNFGELSYLEHFASIGTMLFFETRTSVRIQADYGYKNYLSSIDIIPSSSAGAGNVTGSSSGTTVEGGGPGGSGGGGDSGGGNGGGGNGGGSEGTTPGRKGLNENGNNGGMESTVEYLIYEEPSTTQLSAWINIGQSLSETTGLSVRYLKRWNLTDRGRAFVGGAVDFIGEEDLFDDPYSYESDELSLTVTQMLDHGIKIRGGAFYLLKTYGYPYTLDYSVPDTDLRQDERSGGWVRVEKRFAGDWLLFSGLRLSLGYVYLTNDSNTAYYNYSSNAVSLGLSTDF
jgi:hypothetical protein